MNWQVINLLLINFDGKRYSFQSSLLRESLKILQASSRKNKKGRVFSPSLFESEICCLGYFALGDDHVFNVVYIEIVRNFNPNCVINPIICPNYVIDSAIAHADQFSGLNTV
jgi:hypothetical protein